MSQASRWGVVVVLLSLLVGGVSAGEPGMEIEPVIERVPEPPKQPVSIQEEYVPEPPRVEYEPEAEEPAVCTVTCYRPVWKTREVTCERPVCSYREEVRTCKVPVYRTEKRTRTVTCYRTEWDEITREVCQYVPVTDACGCCSYQPAKCEVPCKVARAVPYEVEQEIDVVKCEYVEKEYTVRVPVWTTEQFVVEQRYCEWEPYEVEVAPQVCCYNPCCY